MPETAKVLIVDDDHLIHALIKAAFKSRGADCLHAYNGQEGLNLYQEHRPALVILDIKMPVMDGIEFLQVLRPQAAECCSIIVCSGCHDAEVRDSCVGLGVKAFMNKPFRIAELMAMASSCLQAAQA